jgi:sugar transferase (PEP-CTERM/EpsH1 system associated)
VKILFVCHRLPFPPKRGGKIRPFNIIRHLGQRHHVTVCSIARSREEEDEGKGLSEHCERAFVGRVANGVQTARMIARLPTRVPSSMGWFYSGSLARRVDELLRNERFDLIFVHCSSVAQYVAGAHATPRILDFGDMDSQKWLEYFRYRPAPMKYGYWLEGTKLQAEEHRLARAFGFCTATTRAEWETLDGYGTGAHTDWFPNGVDAAFFSPDDGGYEPDRICFVGRMDYYPNQECMFDFCRGVWPRVLAKRPSMKLWIVGADPSPAVRKLGGLPNVTVTGSVPDVRPYVRRSAAMIAPLNIARGTQNKILEGMAMGVPVVTTSVAAGGVDALPGEHLWVADRAEETADALVTLASDAGRREALGRAGRERVLSQHAWSSSMSRLDTIIERRLELWARNGGTKQ